MDPCIPSESPRCGSETVDLVYPYNQIKQFLGMKTMFEFFLFIKQSIEMFR